MVLFPWKLTGSTTRKARTTKAKANPNPTAKAGGALVATHFKAVDVDAAKAEETRAKARASQKVSSKESPNMVARSLDVAKANKLIFSSAICVENMGTGAANVQTGWPIRL